MPNPRLAGRYAKSLIDLAIEKNQLEKVYEDMLFVHRLCTESKPFVSLMKSPIIASDKKEKILDALSQGRIGEMTQKFNKLLIHKGREFYLAEIAEAFIEQYKAHNQIHQVKLTTAVAVSDDLKTSIIEAIKKDTDIKKVELKSVVEENIIGGFILEVDSKMIDASVAFELANIKKQFENNDYMYKIR
jgi:F-type H+-transporting ATPase subunit delta